MSECKNGEGQIYVQPLDMSQTEKMTDASNMAVDRLSRIDILVNCAGIAQRSSVLNTELHVFHKIMQVNFFGAVALTKAVLPSMVHRSSGQIVIIGSPAGYLVLRLDPDMRRQNMQYMDSLTVYVQRWRAMGFSLLKSSQDPFERTCRFRV